MDAILGFPLFLVIMAAIYLWSSIRILSEYERGVIFRLGRMRPEAKGPGIILVFTFIDRMERISLRLVALDIPTQDVITRDNVTMKVNAVLYFRVVDANRAVIVVEDFLYATSQLAQTTLRSVLGQTELDELLSAREKINNLLQNILDQQTDPWGVKVTTVEIKHVDLPQEMQRAMAKQAEAERERRAKVINAEGEFQAATRLAEAAGIISQNPAAIQLRFLQSLTEVATESNSTVVLPLPLDIMGPFRRNEEE
ncbi:MAG: slipin family protein [Candidatus Binatia bacterium]|jgi:regulator of protease activity HflC (stomatin/prohibitin superfamily)|nr:slipin family protein [Candidatus Binatia bacterium]